MSLTSSFHSFTSRLSMARRYGLPLKPPQKITARLGRKHALLVGCFRKANGEICFYVTYFG